MLQRYVEKILKEYSQKVACGFIFLYVFINDLFFCSGFFVSLFDILVCVGLFVFLYIAGCSCIKHYETKNYNNIEFILCWSLLLGMGPAFKCG